MSRPTTQTLDAFFTRLQREPDEADVWVEGPFDAGAFSYCLRRAGISAGVFSIDELELPDALLPDHSIGRREQVLIAARAVSTDLGDGLDNVVFAIDRDWDVLAEGPARTYGSYVLPSDAACLETYFWDPEAVQKLMNLSLGIADVDATEVLGQLAPILEEVFICRGAQHRLNLGCRLDSVRTLVEHGEGCELGFDREEYVRRLLMAGGVLHEAERFEEEVSILRSRTKNMSSALLNGHDFIDLLGHALGPHTPSSNRRFLAPVPLALSARTAVDWDHVMSNSSQVQELVGRLARFRG